MVCEFSLSFSLHSKLHWRPSQNSQLLFWQLWYFFNWHTLSSTRLGGILFCVRSDHKKPKHTMFENSQKCLTLLYQEKLFFNFLKNYGKFIISSHFIFGRKIRMRHFWDFLKHCVAKALQPFHVQFVSKWSLEVHLLNWIDHSSRKKINYVDFKTSCLVDKWAPLHHHVFLVLLLQGGQPRF